MEEKNNPNKGIRTTFQKAKDIADTYLKSEGKKTKAKEIEIKDLDAEQNPEQETVNEQNKAENSHESEDVKMKIVELEANLAEIEKERNELKDSVLRKTAEFENLRKRSIKEKQEMIDYANERLLFQFLTIIDDLSNALDASKKSNDFDSLAKGVEMIYNKTVKLFDDQGVSAIENPQGKEFDVHFHEALAHFPSDLPEGTVVQEIQRGYMIKDKVLRHSKVATSAGTE